MRKRESVTIKKIEGGRHEFPCNPLARNGGLRRARESQKPPRNPKDKDENSGSQSGYCERIMKVALREVRSKGKPPLQLQIVNPFPVKS